jgi:hypothetical protein
MTKHIYDNKKLRCRLRQDGKSIQLQLQKRSFLFWLNCFPFVDVKESFWGEDCYTGNPMRMSYAMYGYSESWKTGTLDIRKRVLELFKEYYQEVREENKRAEKFKSIS